MTIDDRARRAADDLADTTRATFDTAGMLARIETSSHRRSRFQQATAVAVVAAVVMTGALLARNQGGTPEPAATPTPTPTPSATGAAAALAADPPIIRADPVHRRSFVIIRLRNTGTRPVYASAGHALIRGGSLGGVVWDSATGDEALQVPVARIDQIIQGDSHRAATLLPDMTYAWLLELTTDCQAPITPDENAYWGNPAPFGMGVSFTSGAAQPLRAGPREIFPVPNPTDPSDLTPPFSGWTLPSWVSYAATAACGPITPGSEITTPFSSPVVTTGVGTRTVDVGSPPEGIAHIDLAIACLSAGTIRVSDGTTWNCTASNVADWPNGGWDLTLKPGEHGTVITATPGTRWRVTTRLYSIQTTPWGVNTNGQTYGVPNSHGSPDLVAVVATTGPSGYVHADQLVHTGEPLTVPVFDSDGETRIGDYTGW